MGQFFQKLSIKMKIAVLITVLMVVTVSSIFVSWFAHQQHVPTFTSQHLIQDVQFDLIELKGQLLLIRAGGDQGKGLVASKIKDIDERIGMLSRESEYKGVRMEPLSGSADLALQSLESAWYGYKSYLNRLISAPKEIDTVVWRNEYLPLADTSIVLANQAVKKVITIANPRYEQALGSSLIHIDDLVVKVDEMAGDYGYQQRANSSIWKFSAALLLLCFVVYFVIFRALDLMLVTPLKQISNVANRMLQNKKIEDPGINPQLETGKIAKALVALDVRMNEAKEYALKLSNGELDETIQGYQEEEEKEGKSMLGGLFTVKDNLLEIRVKEKRATWVNEGITKFVDLLRNDFTSLENFGDAILHNLVPYMDGLLGSLYVVEEVDGETQLVMKGKYAYGNKKHENQVLEPGEGLVGQVYLEKKNIHLTEVPENFLTIQTSIGETAPNAVLIFPLMLNEEVFGVVEIGSLQVFEQFEIEFINRLSELLASSINSVKTNATTNKLLEETQQMTEQMRAQEEEMRQNMEELSATQEEMARKEIEMTGQIDAFKALPYLEFNLDFTFGSASAAFSRIIGVESSDFSGLSLSQIIEPVDGSSDFEEVIRNGELVEIEHAFKGDSRIFYSYVIPVKNKKTADLIKIIVVTESAGVQTEGHGHVSTQLDQLMLEEIEGLKIARESVVGKNQTLSRIEKYLYQQKQAELAVAETKGNVITRANTAFKSLFSAEENDVIGKQLSDLASAFDAGVKQGYEEVTIESSKGTTVHVVLVHPIEGGAEDNFRITLL